MTKTKREVVEDIVDEVELKPALNPYEVRDESDVKGEPCIIVMKEWCDVPLAEVLADAIEDRGYRVKSVKNVPPVWEVLIKEDRP